MIPTTLYIAAAIVVLVVLSIIGLMSRYRKCPSNKMLVVFGSTGKSKDGSLTPAKVLHGGGTFVWPVIQDYAYIDVTPIQISTKAVNILSAQNINVSFPVNLTVAIDTANSQMMQNAASRLLGMDAKGLTNLLTNNLLGGLRQVVANMTIEDLKSDRDGLYEQATKAIKPSLDELGFKIIDLNMEDLEDDGKYLENLSMKAKAEAEAKAKADIAEKEKDGAIREAAARKEMAITVGNTRKEQELTLATIDKEKAEQKAEIEKNKAVAVANQAAEQRANVAKAEAEASKAEALATADAESKTAEANAQAKASVAQSNAESLAKQAEAEAMKQTRIAEAKAKQESASQKAQQEKEAQVAEYNSQKEQRTAKAVQDANVAQQMANIEIAKAEGEAAKAEQESIQKANTAKVVAEMTVAKEKQQRQLEVNEAEAKAQEAKLKAERIVPAEAAKKEAEINAAKAKAVQILQAEAQAESKKKEAEGQAAATQTVAEAEAKATKMKGEAEAAAIQAKLEAEAIVAVEKADGLAKAEVAGILQLSEKLGDPQAAVQFFMKDVTRDTKIAEAYAGSLREVMGNVTVYGDSQTAGNVASSMLNLLPKIKQMGQVLGEGVQTVKSAWNGVTPNEETPKTEQPQDVDSLGEQQFEDVK